MSGNQHITEPSDAPVEEESAEPREITPVDKQPGVVTEIETESEAEVPDPGPTGSVLHRAWLPVLLVVLLVAALVVVGFLVADARASARAEADRATVEEVAQSVTGDLTSINGADSQQNLNRLLGQATEPLRSQLTGLSQVFSTILRQGQVNSQGQVVAAGVESIGGGNANVIVGVNTLVKNSQAPTGLPRNYRMMVTLRYESGLWRASGVDVLP